MGFCLNQALKIRQKIFIKLLKKLNLPFIEVVFAQYTFNKYYVGKGIE